MFNWQLQRAAIRFKRKPNFFLRFLYRSPIILKIFNLLIIFSTKTLLLDKIWFSYFCCLVKGFFFVDFNGNSLFVWSFFIPWYPLSACIKHDGRKCVLLSLYTRKSCLRPFLTQVHIIFPVLLSTTTWLFMVCLFFLPE